MKNKIFHIHVDGTYVLDDLKQRFIECGFAETPFNGHPEGYDHFEPNLHLTLKLPDKISYRERWAAAVELAKSDTGFRGYLEGEFIPEDIDLPERPYTPGMRVPFFITHRKLKGPKAGEPFRRSEFHLTMDKDRSHPDLIKSLLDAGLYGAYLPKSDHTAITLTAQSTVTHETGVLVGMVMAYLAQVGGAVRASIKEEMAVDYYIAGISTEQLPEVIDTIAYR